MNAFVEFPVFSSLDPPLILACVVTRAGARAYLSAMQVNIVNQSGQSVSRAFLLDWIRRLEALAGEKINPKRYQDRELTIVFLDTPAAQKLNRQFRKRDYATDVLSFQ